MGKGGKGKGKYTGGQPWNNWGAWNNMGTQRQWGFRQGNWGNNNNNQNNQNNQIGALTQLLYDKEEKKEWEKWEAQQNADWAKWEAEQKEKDQVLAKERAAEREKLEQLMTDQTKSTIKLIEQQSKAIEARASPQGSPRAHAELGPELPPGARIVYDCPQEFGTYSPRMYGSSGIAEPRRDSYPRDHFSPSSSPPGYSILRPLDDHALAAQRLAHGRAREADDHAAHILALERAREAEERARRAEQEAIETQRRINEAHQREEAARIRAYRAKQHLHAYTGGTAAPYDYSPYDAGTGGDSRAEARMRVHAWAGRPGTPRLGEGAYYPEDELTDEYGLPRDHDGGSGDDLRLHHAPGRDHPRAGGKGLLAPDDADRRYVRDVHFGGKPPSMGRGRGASTGSPFGGHSPSTGRGRGAATLPRGPAIDPLSAARTPTGGAGKGPVHPGSGAARGATPAGRLATAADSSSGAASSGGQRGLFGEMWHRLRSHSPRGRAQGQELDDGLTGSSKRLRFSADGDLEDSLGAAAREQHEAEDHMAMGAASSRGGAHGVPASAAQASFSADSINLAAADAIINAIPELGYSDDDAGLLASMTLPEAVTMVIDARDGIAWKKVFIRVMGKNPQPGKTRNDLCTACITKIVTELGNE